MNASGNAQVAILMGSANDHDTMKIARDTLQESFGIQCDYMAASAHRTPDDVAGYVREAKSKGIKVFIAGAGGAAHLAGVIAAHTTLPVIGIPLDSSPLQGLDALLSTSQMPGGVPVATVSIGKWGAKNAAILAAQIIGVADEGIAAKLDKVKAEQAEKVRSNQPG